VSLIIGLDGLKIWGPLLDLGMVDGAWPFLLRECGFASFTISRKGALSWSSVDPRLSMNLPLSVEGLLELK
jgi:hypothetical protein